MRHSATTRPRAITTALAALAVFATVTLSGGQPAVAATVKATCTNTTSDAGTLQGAIDGSAPGDEIVIDGPCLITATIRLSGNRAYRGDSALTTLTQAPGRNLRAVLGSDSWWNDSATTGEPVTLRDLTVDANKAANPSAGDAVVIRSWNTTVENLRIFDAKASGLRVTNLSKTNVALTNTQVNGTIRNLFISGSGSHGIHVQDTGNAVTDWNLTDSWVASSGGDAIKLENAAGWNVERNHVYGVGGTGVNADRLFASSISDNYIEDFNAHGIGVTVQGDAASTIAGNRIFRFVGSGTIYLAIKQVNYGSGHVAVTGNIIRGSGTGTGLSYQPGSGALTVTSYGNAVTGVSTPRSSPPAVTLGTSY